MHTSSKWAESTQVLTPPVSAETSKSVTKHLIWVHVLPTVLASQLYLEMGVGAVYTSTPAIQKLATPQNPPITQEDMLATDLDPIVSFMVLNSIAVRASFLIILTCMCCNH